MYIKAIFFLMIFLSLIACKEKEISQKKTLEFHTVTNWNTEPSMKFDALCLLNTLTGDPYYLDFYQEAYNYYKPLLTEKALKDLNQLKKVVKDDGGKIISAFYTLYFSATEDETIDELLARLDNDKIIKENLTKANFYSDKEWELFQKSKPYLKGCLEFLKEIRFETYWNENIKPKAEKRISEIKEKLPQFNVIPEIEKKLGKPLESNSIQVYMLYYSQPHGIRITGTRFLTDTAWSFSIVMRNAIHEMMHPPYDMENDTVQAFLNTVKKDSTFQNAFKNRNPAYGYNTEEGLIEEDIVQFTEQIINEKFGIQVNPDSRWQTNDEGLHTLAARMYTWYKQDTTLFKDKKLLEILFLMNTRFQEIH